MIDLLNHGLPPGRKYYFDVLGGIQRLFGYPSRTGSQVEERLVRVSRRLWRQHPEQRPLCCIVTRFLPQLASRCLQGILVDVERPCGKFGRYSSYAVAILSNENNLLIAREADDAGPIHRVYQVELRDLYTATRTHSLLADPEPWSLEDKRRRQHFPGLHPC